eukprot:CAMPEP_0117072054 /NCGR_PEP_ID=MMETSP0472-20121206/50675_1 /TAXON_ID=693140 ORGANISM="Tiarina fusus, Strain LIS" /NCGR_SAMPLE_ID=MMETSP0472 /ASSEMBLY_ACC=CAM_ASM_000603 /LENGTH=67 /DNA_ID=CAMNT_0004795921 /DNA_START=31 /DNA_END=231 /DNA_ORIENTATION=+
MSGDGEWLDTYDDFNKVGKENDIELDDIELDDINLGSDEDLEFGAPEDTSIYVEDDIDFDSEEYHSK